MPYSAENMIPFIDLAAQQERIRPDIDKAIQAVLDHGQYIMGPEVQKTRRPSYRVYRRKTCCQHLKRNRCPVAYV